MSQEKLSKLKKSLDNPQISDAQKVLIKKAIEKLELEISDSNPAEKPEKTDKQRMSTKEIVPLLRAMLQKELPEFKFSVTSTYNKINVDLMSSPYPAYTEGNDLKGGGIHRSMLEDKDETLSPEVKKAFAKIQEFLDEYNYDNSDSMTDYFDVNFYDRLKIGKWDKPYHQITSGIPKPEKKAMEISFKKLRYGGMAYAENDKIIGYINKKQADSRIEKLKKLGYEVSRTMSYPFYVIAMGKTLEKFSEPSTDEHKKELKVKLNIFDMANSIQELIKKVREEAEKNDRLVFIANELDIYTFAFFIQADVVRKTLIKIFAGDNKFDDNYKEFLVALTAKKSKVNDIAKIQEKFVPAILEQFIGKSQLLASRSKEMTEVMSDVLKKILETPVIYGNESEIFHLHYFKGETHVWIKEVDFGTGNQDFGFSLLNGDVQNAELGHVSINEILDSGLELDYYWKPRTLEEIKKELESPKKTTAEKEPTKKLELESAKNPSSEKESDISEFIRKCIARIIFEFGSDVEILDIDEEVVENEIIVGFDLQKGSEKTKITISSNSEKVATGKYGKFEFQFELPANTNVNKFLQKHIGEMDGRSKNEVYPFASFLKEHAETHIGKKVSAKKINSLTESERGKLKSEYSKKVSEGFRAKNESGSKKLRLTKFLKIQGVTQSHIDKVNKSGEGVVIRPVEMVKRGTAQDKKIQALKPGKRLSKNGEIYYEYRTNMADSGKGL